MVPRKGSDIEMRALSFAYPDGTLAFRDVDGSVRGGQCLGILGANGSGKTSILYALAGVIPDIVPGTLWGSVSRRNDMYSPEPTSSEVGSIAFVQQDPEGQLLMSSVEAECAFGPSNFGLDPSIIRECVSQALAAVRLSEFGADAIETLSYGQKQRLAVAAALALKPTALILDEPLANVDAPSCTQMLQAIADLKSAGLTIVLAAQELEGLETILDQVILVGRDGRQVRFGLARDILRDVPLLRREGVRPAAATELAAELRVGPGSGLEELVETLAARITTAGLSRRWVLSGPIGRAATTVEEARKAFALEATALSYSYSRGGPPALTEASVRVSAGECVGVLGLNGSGKSTLLKLLVGLLQPTKGHVRLCGRELRTIPFSKISRQLGAVLQNPEHQLTFAPTVLDEVAVGLRESGRDTSEIEPAVRDALEAVGLTKRGDVYPGKLSFGEKRKLLLACALARRPNMLLLDEPFFGLDSDGKGGLSAILASFVSGGGAALIVSHDLDSIVPIASRLIVLDGGRVVLDGSTLDVMASGELPSHGLREPELLAVWRGLRACGLPVELRTGPTVSLTGC